ncbi:uncharacterized protein LOC106412450 [Brassica napus]|uniref:uncharacterized protein LOC106412450 n=1 Tax=Brassica napus TaxID=3708 RepID=UPI002078711F|nr:uncharacterized protein LOC106412450 [Brassica napus]
MGIRALKEVNKVAGLKLIWRLLTWDSLWGKWIKNNLLKRKCFWEVKKNTQAGSWMWRKLLKQRDTAKRFYKKNIGNGRSTSFWYENWSSKGILFERLGERGALVMGIRNEATVEEAVLKARRRKHRNTLLTEVEAKLTKVEEKISENSEDVCLWNWGRGIWFAQATPKFAFLAWLAMLNRLATMDRIEKWSQGVVWMLHIWEHLVKGILGRDFTTDWSEVVVLLSRVDNDKKRSFCTRYAFQTIVHTVWMERNKIRHGEKPLPLEVMKKRINKGVRNKLSIMRLKGGKGMENALQYWFSTRV